MMDSFYIVLYFIIMAGFGASLGSFGTVIYYRLINKEGRRSVSLFKPLYSICPSCKQRIAVYDNIPIFGYLFLKGKCRYCGSPIPLKYLFLEIIFACIGLIVGIVIYRIYL